MCPQNCEKLLFELVAPNQTPVLLETTWVKIPHSILGYPVGFKLETGDLSAPAGRGAGACSRWFFFSVNGDGSKLSQNLLMWTTQCHKPDHLGMLCTTHHFYGDLGISLGRWLGLPPILTIFGECPSINRATSGYHPGARVLTHSKMGHNLDAIRPGPRILSYWWPALKLAPYLP